jgi:TPR repeat protein
MRFTSLLTAALFVLPGWPALAGWDEGLAAYQRQDWAGAVREFQPLADKGHTGAQARLGQLQLDGLGIPRNEIEAVTRLTGAANSGDALAQYWLGRVYFFGRGVPKDPAMAVLWFSRAAAQDYSDALHMLGELYFNGLGVPKDEAKGAEYQRRCAERGSIACIDRVAGYYWDGRGVAQNRARAVEYAKRSAEAGHARGQMILGLAAFLGDGLPQDRAKAVDWFRRAAEQGEVIAQHNLGQAYRNGLGTAADPAEGYFWLAIAATNATPALKAGYEKDRDLVGATLSPDQAAATRQRAAAWKPRGLVVQVVRISPPPMSPTPPVSQPPAAAPPPPVGGGGEVQPRPALTSGSGFFVSREGMVLTNAHVVENCRNITIQPLDGSAQTAAVVARDAANDLALLKSSVRPSEVARFREDRPLRSGDEVVVVGFPLSTILSREANVTAGVISAMAGIRGDRRHYQLTAPVQKGNSGGPLADMSGNVVGIVSAKLNAMRIAGQYGDLPQNINFAIKSELARKFLSDSAVAYETADASQTLSSADVGERMKRVTVFVECGG